MTMRLRTVILGFLLLLALISAHSQTAHSQTTYSQTTYPQVSRRSPHKAAAATPASAANDKEIVTTIREMEETLRRAALHGDGSWWERHLDENYVGVDPQGQTSTKADAVQLHNSPDLKYDEVSFGDFTVRTYNSDTVVLTGVNTIAGSYKGQDFTGHYHFMQVWIKEAAEWKLAVSQTGKLGP
jgi:Domain of unknown function (DUF4440)